MLTWKQINEVRQIIREAEKKIEDLEQEILAIGLKINQERNSKKRQELHKEGEILEKKRKKVLDVLERTTRFTIENYTGFRVVVERKFESLEVEEEFEKLKRQKRA